MTGINLASSGVALLTMLCTLLGAVYERRRFPGHRSVFPSMIACAACMDAGMVLAWTAVEIEKGNLFLVYFCVSVVFYYAILALFFCGIRNYFAQRGVAVGYTARLTVLICALSALGWVVSCFNGMFYTLSAAGLGAPGPYYLLGQIGGYWVVMATVVLVLRRRRMLERGVLVSFLLFPVLPMLAGPLQWAHPGLHLMPLLLSAAVLQIYSFLHLEQTQRLRKRQIRLTQDRISISLSQIRPHFLYNTLNSIYFLCASDPEQAQRAIEDFSAYLRGNLENLEQSAEIPLQQELDHVRHYLRLEQMRFGEELRVEYDIAAAGFSVPPLSIQPLAENAVKHGLMPRAGGGTVTIRTRERDDAYEIAVEDDGVGYDPEALLEDDRMHIGIQNVRERLQDICRGALTIQSAPGAGTTAVIRIPKQGRRRRAHG